MNSKFLFFILTLLSLWLIVGCTNQAAIENTNDNEQFFQVKKVAWAFMEEKGWTNTTRGDWQSATVKNVIATNNYQLFDNADEGKEALSVTFEDKENIVISAPTILVDPVTNKVIGYMPGE